MDKAGELVGSKEITYRFGNQRVSAAKMEARFQQDDGSLTLVQEIAGHVATEIAEFKARMMRKQLIRMGWTPPPATLSLRGLLEYNRQWFRFQLFKRRGR